MARIYMERLIKTVIELSHGNDWDTAVVEWEIIDCEEDSTLSESCICGKEHLFYLFTIKNIITGSTLFPIGSSCIKKFGRDDLNDEASVREKMFKLYHAVENNQFISLSPEFFSRKLLKKLFEDGAFDCEYNDYDGLDDYEFIVKMFNKRDKSSSHVTVVRPAKENLIFYIGLWGVLHEREIESLHTGSTGQTELPKERVKALELHLPDNGTLDRFNTLIAPMAAAIVSKQNENNKLATLRDALLPKLMSGEIDVSAVQL